MSLYFCSYSILRLTHIVNSLRSQSRFHDPNQDSVFAHSNSVTAYSNWSTKTASGSSTPTSNIHTPPVEFERDPSASLTVKTSTGTHILPSLVTPRTSFGKRIR